MKPNQLDQQDVAHLQGKLIRDLGECRPRGVGREQRYVEMFDMPHGESDWSWRKIPSQGYDIAVQRFLPKLNTSAEKAKGTFAG